MAERLLRWLAVTAAGVAVWVLTRDALPLPPILDPARIPQWWSGAGPMAGTGSLLRLIVTTALAGWSIGQGVTALLRSGRSARRLADTGRAHPRRAWARIRSTGSFVRLAVGLTSSGGVLGACGAAGPPGSAAVPAAPVLVSPPSPAVVATPPSTAPETTVPPATRSTPVIGAVSAPLPPRPRRSAAKTGASGAGPATWTVRPGDDFWSIADAVVAGRAPTPRSERDVAAYWTRLIEANWGRLPRPGDPDLLFPGDSVVLPPL